MGTYFKHFYTLTIKNDWLCKHHFAGTKGNSSNKIRGQRGILYYFNNIAFLSYTVLKHKSTGWSFCINFSLQIRIFYVKISPFYNFKHPFPRCFFTEKKITFILWFIAAGSYTIDCFNIQTSVLTTPKRQSQISVWLSR